MRTILIILQKEFRQVFRNRTMLPIIFAVPLVQLLILAYAVTFEIRKINIVIVDHDRSQVSRELISRFRAPKFYTIKGYEENYINAEDYLKRGDAHQVLVIPAGFDKELKNESKAKVQLVTNAIDGAAAALMNAYGTMIISDFNLDLVVEKTGLSFEPPFRITQSFWYNPELNYTTFMIPGILVLLVTIVGMFLSAMNVVREKEIGTIEQINVTPVRKYQFIAGKLIPFWIIALFDLAFGLALAKIVFDIPIVGNLWLIFGVAGIYLFAALGIGLFISTLSNTQQQAMFLAWFFAVVFIMMSGLFTPVENMPRWAQHINVINPVSYFIRIIRMLMLKGSGLADIIKPLLSLLAYAVVALSMAVWRYRKTS